jgi:hypothetical protein
MRLYLSWPELEDDAMNRGFAWPLVLVAATVLMGVLIKIEPGNDLRVAAAFLYLLICPGMAFVRLLNLSSRLMEWVLAVAASITLDLIISEILVLIHQWSPTAAFFAIGLFCVAGGMAQVIFPRQGIPGRHGTA